MGDINYYRTYTDEIFKLFESFKESGFSKEEAFELVKAFSNQTAMDNVYSSAKKSDVRELRRRMSALKAQQKADEDIKKIVIPKGEAIDD